MATLANVWAARKWPVTLITLSSPQSDVYPLDGRVQRVSLGLLQNSAHLYDAVQNNWRRIRALRKVLLDASPNVVLSFETTTNIQTIVACYRTNIPVVVSERNSLADHPPRHVWRWLLPPIYRHAAGIATLTHRGATYLEATVNARVGVIPNPVTITRQSKVSPRAEALMNALPTRFKLLAMGRLTSQKGFDLLIHAFSHVAKLHPDWSLIILGEGEGRDDLEGLARSYGLANRVAMPGFIESPQDIMHAADAFVLSSRYEGMPNALLEAMGCGLACVSFDCRTGPAELIQHGVSGLLASPEDVGALAECLAHVFTDAALRERLGVAGYNTIIQRLNIDAVISRWEDLLITAIRSKGTT